MSLIKLNPRIQRTTGRKAGDLLTFTPFYHPNIGYVRQSMPLALTGAMFCLVSSVFAHWSNVWAAGAAESPLLPL